MKKTEILVKDFYIKVIKKSITPAVIAGITFFFNPVSESNAINNRVYQDPVNEAFCLNESPIELDNHVTLYPNEVPSELSLIDSPIAETLDATFKQNCRNIDTAYPVFKDLLTAVSSLPVEDGYADYGNKSGNIHLNMFLKDDLRLTIDKNVSAEDDIVFFSLSVNSDILAMDAMGLHEVIDIVKKLLS